MAYRLRDGLSWCICDQQAVFLDLSRDRYFRLSRDDNSRFQQWRTSTETSRADAERLIGIGVLVPGSSSQASPTQALLEPPTADLADQTNGTARFTDIGRCLVAQRRARSKIRRGELAATLAVISSDRKPIKTPDGSCVATVRRIAAAFASTPLAFQKAGQCLPRALAAQILCRAAGANPTLVFGVRLEPFAAHCWLQLDSEVIVGDLEQARMFTPILAVP